MAGAFQNCCCGCRRSVITARLGHNHWNGLYYPSIDFVDFRGWLTSTCHYEYNFSAGPDSVAWSVDFAVSMDRLTGFVRSFSPGAVDATTRAHINQAMSETNLPTALYPEDTGSRDFDFGGGYTRHIEWTRSPALASFRYVDTSPTATLTIIWSVTLTEQYTDTLLQDDLFDLAFNTPLIVVNPTTGEVLKGFDGLPPGVDAVIFYPAPSFVPPARIGSYAPDILAVLDNPGLYGAAIPARTFTATANNITACVVGDGGTTGSEVGAILRASSNVTPGGELLATRFYRQDRFCKFDRVIYSAWPMSSAPISGEFYENCSTLLTVPGKNYIEVIPARFSDWPDALAKNQWRRVYVKNRNAETGSVATPRSTGGICDCYAP